MAILIVDDERSTRTALRDLLAQMGHKAILEAKHGEEALRTAVAEKARLRMIVADWEMPYMDGIRLLEEVQGRPELDLAPFLLITSDLPRSRLKALQERTDRLDGFLIKPFRMKSLAEAMDSAQAHRARTRDVVLAYEPRGPLDGLRGALSGRRLVIAATPEELRTQARACARRLGCVALQPGAEIADWLSSFSRSPLGASTPVICASRAPSEIFPIRTLCQAFLPADAPAPAWRAALDALSTRSEASLRLELLFQDLKEALQRKDSEQALRSSLAALTADPANPEAHATAGDLLLARGARAEALRHYRAALEANPCQPRPYIRLLEACAKDDALDSIAAAAAGFCPQNQDVLLAAARALRGSGRFEGARSVAQRLLQLNPSHPEAQSLLSGTPETGAPESARP